MCEEFETHQDRSGQPDVLMGQSIVLSEIKAEVPLENDIPSHQNFFYCSDMKNESNCFPQENKVSKFCMDADLYMLLRLDSISRLKTLKNSFFARACCEYTLPEVTNHHNQKDGFRETQKLDPYWKSRPVICTANMELKSESCL